MNNRVLLINVPGKGYYSPDEKAILFPATGILLVGNSLKRAGYEVDFVDGTLYDDYIRTILDKCELGYLFVGMSVMTMQVPYASKLSMRIKEKYPQTNIVWGGIHPTLFPDEIAAFPYVDYVVVNEAIKSVVEIAEKLQQGKQKEKIVYQTEPDNIKDTENLNYEVINIKSYLYNNLQFHTLKLPCGALKTNFLSFLQCGALKTNFLSLTGGHRAH